MLGHVLIVGGTGMLRGVSLRLTAQSRTVSVLARSHARLSSLAREASARLPPGAQGVHPIAVDWHDTQRLALGLRAAVAAHGPIELAVCWVHADAPEALPTIFDILGSEARRDEEPRVFHVVGSSRADPATVREPEEALATGLRYRRIVLGFIIEPVTGATRWLTDEEISAGVIDAVDRDAEDSIIGVVKPWERHP